MKFLDTNHKFSYISDFVTKLDTLNNGEEMQHARGMFVTPYNGLTTLNQNDRGLGIRSEFIYVPDLNIGVIIFANSEQINLVNVSYKILEIWTQELPHYQESLNKISP